MANSSFFLFIWFIQSLLKKTTNEALKFPSWNNLLASSLSASDRKAQLSIKAKYSLSDKLANELIWRSKFWLSPIYQFFYFMGYAFHIRTFYQALGL